MTIEPGGALAVAIEHLYEVFATYPLSPHVTGCPCCVGEADDALIHSAPLRQLKPDALARYAFKAMTTWGTVDDFRHFLPRIFELVSVDGGGSWIDPEVVFGKLRYGDWDRWPAHERRAIEAYFKAQWLDVLGRFPHPFGADHALRCIGCAAADMTPYLKHWNISGSRAAACHFADFLEWNACGVRLEPTEIWELSSAWWSDRPEQARQVRDWMVADERLEELERAFFAFSDDEVTAGILSEGFNYLGALRSAAVPPAVE